MNERRQLPRWKIKQEAMVWMPEEPILASHCLIENMHLKGMCVSFHKRLPNEKTARMTFAVGDDNDHIKIMARILWKKEYQGFYVYGLSFVKIDETDRDKMYQYINTHCYDQFKNNWWAV